MPDMDQEMVDQERRESGDRRFLHRDELGRREDDRASQHVLSDTQEAAIRTPGSAGRYILMLAGVLLAGMTAIYSANKTLAPMLNDPDRIDRTAAILSTGQSYHTYDLNIETRRLR
ncbi:MAG: hypothetical protein AAFW46_18095, partial [Pseudomonadota bacterium]